MPAPYPLPANLTGFAALARYNNSVTNNLLGPAIMLAMTVIFFGFMLTRFGKRPALGATGIIMAVLSILLRFSLLIEDYVMFFFIMLGLSSIIYLFFSEG